MSDALIIRYTHQGDTPKILHFIQALAEYEKLSHQCVVTESQLKETLFGERAYAEVVIAEWQGQACGFALFFHTYSTFLGKPGIHLEDLFVEPDFRGKGIGKELLAFLAKTAIDRGCGRLEWVVLDWNQPSIDFYRSQKADSLDDWMTFRLSDEHLQNLANQATAKVVRPE